MKPKLLYDTACLDLLPDPDEPAEKPLNPFAPDGRCFRLDIDLPLANPNGRLSDEEVLIVGFSWEPGLTAALICPVGFTNADFARELNAWYQTTIGRNGDPSYGALGDHVFVEGIEPSSRPGIDVELQLGS